MLLNNVCAFMGEEGVEDKSDLYRKARNRLLGELNDKYHNVWHTKQNTCMNVCNIYIITRISNLNLLIHHL